MVRIDAAVVAASGNPHFHPETHDDHAEAEPSVSLRDLALFAPAES